MKRLTLHLLWLFLCLTMTLPPIGLWLWNLEGNAVIRSWPGWFTPDVRDRLDRVLFWGLVFGIPLAFGGLVGGVYRFFRCLRTEVFWRVVFALTSILALIGMFEVCSLLRFLKG